MTIKQLLDQGFIVPSNSPVLSQVVVARSGNRDWRMCIDYTPLNKITKKFTYQLPHIKQLLAEMCGFKFFSTLDLKKGYHQIKMHADSAYLTAFTTSIGNYEWKVIPFGLTNAPTKPCNTSSDIIF